MSCTRIPLGPTVGRPDLPGITRTWSPRGAPTCCSHLPGWRGRFWQRRTLSRADLVTTVSAYMGAAAVRDGAIADRVVEVQFGVDTGRYVPASVPAASLRRLGIDERPFVFSPRAVKPIYNHETILEAFARLGIGYQLVMTSRNAEPAHLEWLLTEIERRGLGDRVRIVGDAAEDDMLALYQAAAVVVSAPLSDAFRSACSRPWHAAHRWWSATCPGSVPCWRARSRPRSSPPGMPRRWPRPCGRTLEMSPEQRRAAGRHPPRAGGPHRRLRVEHAAHGGSLPRAGRRGGPSPRAAAAPGSRRTRRSLGRSPPAGRCRARIR